MEWTPPTRTATPLRPSAWAQPLACTSPRCTSAPWRTRSQRAPRLSDDRPALPSGLYDLLLTDNLQRLLGSDPTAQHPLQALASDAAPTLADNLVRQIAARLEDLPGDGAEAAQRQLPLVNRLVTWWADGLHRINALILHCASYILVST